jgi:hypothetical protein
MKKVRWVGFDMDECLGSFSPLYTFLHEIRETLRTKMSPYEIDYMFEQQILNSEFVGFTWLFRPAIFHALRFVYLAYLHRQIEGAFILSNNGSGELVRFVGFLCNAIIGRLYPCHEPLMIFKMAVHANASCRIPDGVKNFAVIQDCLRAHNLPTMNNTNDLLFFDDQLHVLSHEIPHYIQMRPYRNYTDVNILGQSLMKFHSIMSAAKWHKIIQNAQLNQHRDGLALEYRYIFDTAHTPDEMIHFHNDLQQINTAFHNFLSPYNKGKRKNGTRIRKTSEIR